MGALLDDFAVVDDEDEIGVHDGREAVSDDEGGAAVGEFIESGLDEAFGARVNIAGRFVKNHHRRIGDHGAGDGEELFFAGGDVVRILVDFGFVALVERADEVVDMSGFTSTNHVSFRCVAFSVAQVFFDRAGEEPGVLEDHTEEATNVFASHAARIDAIDFYGSLFGVIEAHEEIYDRGFSGAGRADESDL